MALGGSVGAAPRPASPTSPAATSLSLPALSTKDARYLLWDVLADLAAPVIDGLADVADFLLKSLRAVFAVLPLD